MVVVRFVSCYSLLLYCVIKYCRAEGIAKQQAPHSGHSLNLFGVHQ